MNNWKIGDVVMVQDYSEAHGDVGTIYYIQIDGLVLVELDECLWPVAPTQIVRVELDAVEGEKG